ncbi:TPA: hypothetical protein R1X42_001621, partial [Campylobacter upsaliensis]|nr:hypothetical protein [Campylobacter upsaliensis]
FSAASNEGLENNLGEQGVSLFAKYQDKIKALKEAKKPFVADDVYNLKYLVNKALGETSITKENDTSKALFASLARGRNNTILKALNELEKENLEQVSKVANMFFDNAGAFYNLTHDLDMPKMQNLQNYFSDVLVSAAKADFTRAEDFTKLNEDIRAFLDSSDKNAMLKLSPNLVSDLLTKALGAGFARFARLENPSSSLFDFLNGLKAELIEKGAPDLFSGGKGIKLNERDEFDFAKELILKGQDSEAKFKLYGNLEELKAWKSKSSLNQLTKESLDKDLNKSYTLELENLEPISLNANALSKETEALTQSVESGHKQSATIAKTDEQSIAQKAKNDEVLEAEVIEEVGLNEPMKFLEFQQRKLLTYIKENTPLRLLEHKKELKTRDILNFLEQSALNGKQKVFLMQNLERDFTKLKEDFKELESQSFKRDLLDKTKPLRKAEKEELTSEVLEQVQKENLKLYLNDTSGNLTKFLNAKKPFKITMRGANIKHILNRHGENSTLAKNGQPFVNLEDIKKYDEIINNADRQILKENDKGEKTLLSGKQINGHYIVISSVRLKNGELKLKTMYKENGKLENDKAFKSVKLPSETPSVLRGQSLTTDLDGYPSHADESIAQNAKSESEKEVLERQIPFIEAEIQKYEAKIASLDERIKKTQTRIQPYLDEINALQKQYDELYFTETRGEEANAKKYLKLEEIKAKQEELRKPYNDALFKFVFPHQRLKGKVQTEIQKLKFGLQDRVLRLEEIQNEALNTSKAQKAWLEAFNLKSLEEEAIVEIPADLKERLGKEIKLNKKDFEKLMKNKREKYIPQIKETFKEPEAVFIDENDDLIFTKTFNDKLFFVNVNRDYGEAFKALSLAPKKNNNLLNKLNKAKEILKLDSKLRDYTAQQAFTGVLSASNKSSGEIIPQIPKDNSQLNVLHTKIQQVRQQIAESKNPDKEYLHQVFKPDEIIELEKQYFNQAMPQEYKELIQDFPQLYEQRLANELKEAYVKDTDVIQEVSAQLLNDFKDKSFKDTAKHAKLLLFNTLRDKAQELGFKELDINKPSFKVAFGKFQAKLKKGDIQDLSEHIAINSLQHDRLRIQEALNLTPLKEFGTNYAEFYRDGKGAVEKLLAEKQGQVAGAFYKEGLGEIDLVWGDEKIGLKKIIEKHLSDFENFEGKDEAEKMVNALNEIIEKGKIITENGINTLWLKKGDEYYLVGLSKGWNGKGEN